MPKQCSEQGWRPARNLRFAQQLEAIALTEAELARVAQSVPVAFMASDQGWRAMAVFAPGDGHNRFVIPATGGWRGHYIPALLRAYPFMLDPKAEDRLSLWPGVTPEPITEGVLRFEEGGMPTPRVQRIFRLLSRARAGMAPLAQTLATLSEFGLLTPWLGTNNEPITLNQKRLHVVNAERLQQLPDATFLQLRHLNALPWIYAHLQSLHHQKQFAQPVHELPEMVDFTPSHMNETESEQPVSASTAELLSALSLDTGDVEL